MEHGSAIDASSRSVTSSTANNETAEYSPMDVTDTESPPMEDDPQQGLEVEVKSQQLSPPTSTKQQTPRPPVTLDWMKDVTGRNWEIYWTGEDMPGWYEGRIMGRRGRSFRVRFDGDPNVYNMPLRPDVVRPSARVWIRKTMSIIQNESDRVPDTQSLTEATAIAQIREKVKEEFPVLKLETDYCDAEMQHHLINMQEQHESCCRLLTEARIQLFLRTSLGNMQEGEHFDSESNEEMDEEVDEEYEDGQSDSDGDDQDPYEPSDTLTNYLLFCLQKVDEACVWHHKCYSLFLNLFVKSPNLALETIKREFLVIECLSGGRHVLENIFRTKDCSKSAADKFETEMEPHQSESVSGTPRKRTRSDTGTPTDNPNASETIAGFTDSSAVAETSGQHRKRRKSDSRSGEWFIPNMNEGSTSSMDEDEDELSVNDRKFGCGASAQQSSSQRNGSEVPSSKGNEEDKLLQHDFVTAFVKEMLEKDSRWLSHHCGEMLCMLSAHIVARYVRWEHLAQFYLGERDSMDLKISDGETTAPDQSDLGSPRGSLQRKKQQNFITLEDLNALVSQAKTDAFLQRFPISGYMTRLEGKISAVVQFERKAWNLIHYVLDDTGDDTTIPTDNDEGDSVEQGLRELWQALNTEKGSVENVNPIGPKTSSLTRSVIENAMLYRRWYLDLIHAESKRERVSFVDNLVSRLSRLPPLPTFIGSEEGAVKLNNVASRARSLSSICWDHLANFSRYQSVLEERKSINNSGEKFLTVDGVQSILAELRLLKVVSTAEEMLTIRLDVLLWVDQAEDLLSSTTPQFCDLAGVYSLATRILKGKSETRLHLLEGLKHSSAVEAEMKAFAHGDMDQIPLNDLHRKLSSLFIVASEWKKKADGLNLIINAGKKNKVRPKKTINTKRIVSLLTEYSKLGVHCISEFGELKDALDSAVSWGDFMKRVGSDDSISFERLLELLEEEKSGVSCALSLEPSWEVVDDLVSLLRWYSNAKRLLNYNDIDLRELHSILWRGADVLQMYSEHETVLVNMQEVKGVQKLELSPIKTDPVTCSVLMRILSKSRDVQEKSVIHNLLTLRWLLSVADFVTKRVEGTSSQTLSNARALLKRSRSLEGNLKVRETDFSVKFRLEELNRLVHGAESMETRVREALALSDAYLKDTFSRKSEVEAFSNDLQLIQGDLKQWQLSAVSISLDNAIQTKLQREVRRISWVIQTFPFRAIYAAREEGDLADRVPLHVLETLKSSSPDGVLEGDLARAVSRVRELLSSARNWLESAHTLTMQTKKRHTGDAGGSTDTIMVHSLDVEYIDRLLNNKLLQQVVLPNESEICKSLECTMKLELGLMSLFENDYTGKLVDNVAIPEDEKSLIGHDGSFFLLRLTGNPMFQSMMSSIHALDQFLPDVIDGSPGVDVLSWLRLVCQWILSIQAGNSSPEECSHFSIPIDKARSLLASGDELFLNLTDDLKKKLGAHKLYVAASQSGKLSVKTKRDGAHQSVGATCIRWCPFLYDALKSDLSKYDAWETSITRMFNDFVASQKKAEADRTSLAEDMLSQHEDMWLLLHEAIDLVIMPSKEKLLAPCQIVMAKIAGLVKSETTEGSFKSFYFSRFRETSMLVKSRFDLLDALIARCDADNSTGLVPPETIDENRKDPFRVYCRNVLTEALSKVAERLSITAASVSTAYVMKGWEIESALFDKYQLEVGERQITPGYRDKARALRRALEDPKNVEFGAKVLGGRISVDELVGMDSDEMANSFKKREREKATMIARQGTYLLGTTFTKHGVQSSSKPSTMTEQSQAQPKIDPLVQQGEGGSAIEAARSLAPKESSSHRRGSLTRAETGGPKSTSILRNPRKLDQLVRKTIGPPPPPPPSLAMAIRPSSTTTASASKNQRRAVSDSGGDRFTFTMGQFNFTAALELERDVRHVGNGLLPEILKDQGRSSPADMSSFIEAKLKGGRWEAVTFRVLTISTTDEKNYKSFYKDYEQKKRVAMLRLNDRKAFLVTPKFLPSVPRLSFLKKSSSYLVVLTHNE